MTKNISTILCPLDLSEHSRTVAEYAATFAAKFGAKIIAVNITPTFTQYLGVNVSSNSIDSLTKEVHLEADHALNQLLEESFKGIEVEAKIIAGHPADAIVDFAQTSNADIIIMGTHGHQGINRIIFGSVAEGVVKNSPVPVITIRPIGEAKPA